MATHIEQYGLALHRLGYDVVPIPAGSKGCFVKGWQSIVATEEVMRDWTINHAGCGIRGPRTVGVDIDCRDETLTLHMMNFIRQRLGDVPHRVGMPPKALLPYRCEQPFSKLKTPEFYSSDGQKHQLEVLADGQQFVASHIHPDTGKPYLWHYADGMEVETLTIPWADLPLITVGDAKVIIAEFEAQCERRSWKPKTASRQKQSYSAPGQRNRHRYTEADVRGMLTCLDPGMDYDRWLHIGMALHHGGFSVDLWDEWSQGSSKYKRGECQEKWASFSARGHA